MTDPATNKYGVIYGRKHWCQCGAESVTDLPITLGIGTGWNGGMKNAVSTLPLCADCLKKEQQQEADRYGRGEDRRAHFKQPGVWR